MSPPRRARNRRGAHAHEDYPTRDDANWRKHSLAWVDGAKVRLEYRAVHKDPLTTEAEWRDQPEEDRPGRAQVLMEQAGYAAGYSGTPLARKLGLKAGQAVAFIGLPDSLAYLHDAAEFRRIELAPDWRALPEGARDVIHLFTRSAAEVVGGAAGAARHDRGGWHDLGVLAQKGVQGADGCDRGYHPQPGVGGCAGGRQGLRGG